MEKINKTVLKVKDTIQKMDKRHKIIFIFPLVSIILGILSFCIPVVWQPDKIYWIWGLTFSKQTGFDFLTIYRLFWSLVSSMILILTIYALIQNTRYIYSIKRRKESNIIKFWLAWILIGIALIFTAILYFRLYPNLILGFSYPNAFEFPFLIYSAGGIMIIAGITLRVFYYFEPSLIE